jgi:hypothetical protein
MQICVITRRLHVRFKVVTAVLLEIKVFGMWRYVDWYRITDVSKDRTGYWETSTCVEQKRNSRLHVRTRTKLESVVTVTFARIRCYQVRFEVFTALSVNSAVLWVVTTCSFFFEVHRRFRLSCCLHHLSKVMNDGDSRIFWNFVAFLPYYTVSYPWRLEAASLLRLPKSHIFIVINSLRHGGRYIYYPCYVDPCHRVKWVPVTTAWRVHRLRMEERPPVMEGSCEYIE